MKDRPRSLLPALALAFLGAAYLPKLGLPLIWDDRPTIVFNAALDHPVPLARYLSPDYFGFSGEATWRPSCWRGATPADYDGMPVATTGSGRSVVSGSPNSPAWNSLPAAICASEGFP